MFSHLVENGFVATFGMVLLHTLWQGALIWGIAALVLEWQRRAGATARYATACIALMLLLAGPIATLAWSASSARPTPTGVILSGAGAEKVELSDRPRDEAVAQPLTVDASEPASGIQGRFASISIERLVHTFAPWAAIAWMVVVPLLLVRLLAHYTWLRMVHLRDAEPAPPSMQEVVLRLCERMRYSRPVRLLMSTRVAVPVVIGWFKPVVVLPAAFLAGIPVEQLEALLAHELAHLRRLDPIVNFIQCIAETVLFFHPAIWWLSRRIRIEREYCCDDHALAMGTRPTLYAESLIALAEKATGSSAYALSSTGGVLLARIRRILGVDAGPHAIIRIGVLSAAVSIALMLSICAYVLAADQNLASSGEEQISVGQSENMGSALISSGEEQAVPGQLVFPADRSLGEVKFRRAGADYAASYWDRGFQFGWRSICPAQGTVIVPEGEDVCLNFTGSDLSILSTFRPDSIARFECYSKDLTDEDIKPLASLTGIRSLSLLNSKGLTDRGIEELATLQNMGSLQLHKTGVQKLTFVNSFPRLVELGLAGSAVDEEGMANLAAADLPNLELLNISDVALTEQGFAYAASVNVKALLLGAMEVGDTWFKYLADASRIEFLVARWPGLDDMDLKNLQNIRSLRLLKIPFTRVSDAGMTYVAAMPALEQLIMYKTAVTEDCLPTLAASKTLWEVEASNTDISYASLKEWRMKNNFKRRILPEPSERQRSTNPRALKVGFLLSDFQATGPHWMRDPYGYQMDEYRAWIIDLLGEANVDLYAVIEPGTEKLGELPDILAYTGLSAKTVNSTDPAALVKLDVVCTWRSCDILPETLAALQAAVGQGLGLVCNSNFGNVSPELGDAAVMDLMGHSAQKYTWSGEGARTFEILNAHPILGGLKPGTKLEGILYNGAYDPNGPPQGTVLIGPGPDHRDTFYPMYLREYGKGRIVVNVFWNLGIGDIPPETFYMRCVNWAAGRPVDTKY